MIQQPNLLIEIDDVTVMNRSTKTPSELLLHVAKILMNYILKNVYWKTV